MLKLTHHNVGLIMLHAEERLAG